MKIVKKNVKNIAMEIAVDFMMALAMVISMEISIDFVFVVIHQRTQSPNCLTVFLSSLFHFLPHLTTDSSPFRHFQGRVLYDVIIYNASSPRSEIQKYLLECDAAVAPDIVSHLKKYKLRKNCDIVDISDVYEVSFLLLALGMG